MWLNHCGSMTDLITDFPGDPFGGVGQDLDWIASVHPLVLIGGVLDLPFSLIIDIVLLPWTLTVGSLG
jgi:uncharacterized protein YceK